MSFLFGMAMIYYSVSSIETYFGDKQADFGVMLLFNALMALLFATLANDAMIMQNPFVFSIIYTWSKLVPD